MAAKLKHEAPGFYEFGKIDATAFQGKLTAVKVDPSQGFWQIESNAFQVGNDQVQRNSTGSPAIADTGTTLLMVDDNVARTYYDQVDGAAFDENQGLFTFPCASELPDFKVALGPTYMATIHSGLLNFEQIDEQSKSPFFESACAGGLQGNQGAGLLIYGDVLFKSQFAVFNIQDLVVQFAPHLYT